MSEKTREKYWQEQAGKMAVIANWALNELLAFEPTSETLADEANEALEEVQAFLNMSEDE